MNTYSVFGNPILHSKSPQLFAPLLQTGDVYIRIRPQSAQDLVNIVRKLSIKGASITAPFKESVLPLLDEVSDSARAIGAVNCIRNDKGVLHGHNTDCFGVTVSLAEAGISLPGANVLVLGAGGAARAAVYGLVNVGAKVYLSNRTTSKADAIARVFGATPINWQSPGTLPYFDAVVSTILPGALPPFAGYLATGFLLDAVYKPSEMTVHCRGRGVKVIPGERWLIHQGIFAAEFYINERQKNDSQGPERHKARVPPLEVALKKHLQPKNLRIFVLNEESLEGFEPAQYDLIVSGFGLRQEAVNQIIDEEKRLAFGG